MVDGNEPYIGKEYDLLELREEDLDPDPIKQFAKWYQDAFESDSLQPNAMTLATATAQGKPSARMMLLKGFDENGFVFYTNRESVKGEDLSENPQAALVFWWPVMERQVRIEGMTTKVPDNEENSYFETRPRGSRIGAWSSQQSVVISSREALDKKYKELDEIYMNKDIPKPPYWTGYRLIPSSIEFWQGRPNRLHDRLRYRVVSDKGWIIERLAP